MIESCFINQNIISVMGDDCTCMDIFQHTMTLINPEMLYHQVQCLTYEANSRNFGEEIFLEIPHD